MANLLSALQFYLPEIYFFSLALGCILVIFTGLYIGRSVARKLRKKTWSKDPHLKSLNTPSKSIVDFIHSFQEFISIKSKTLKNFIGMIDKNEISLSFYRTFDILKSYLGSSQACYKLPWYLMLGTQDSGKTTLINQLDIERPIGRPDYIDSQDLSKIGWHFFDKAIVIDLKGQIFLEKNFQKSDTHSFNYILTLFNRFRARRPLDGIILTLPADELYHHQLIQEKISERAKYICEQLWTLQNHLGLKIPVYVVITKCDVLPGFNDFTFDLPENLRQEIFGWSSPYTLETNYNPTWTDDIFHYVLKTLKEFRTTFFTQNSVQITEKQEKHFIFSLEFMKLKNALSTYLNTIFKNSTYHDSFFLRGVYFCGQNQDFEQNSLSISSSSYYPPQSFSKIFFVKDLFEKKIFKESNLASPIQKILLSTNKFLNKVKLAVVCFSILWIVGLSNSYYHLSKNIKTILPAMTQINLSLKGLRNFSQNKNDAKLQSYYLDETDKILKNFAKIQIESMNFLSLPLSWISSIDQKILKSITISYDRIILPSLNAGLLRKINEITSINTQSSSSISHEPGIYNPLFFDSFKQLNTYIDQILLLEKFITSYNSLSTTNSIADLGQLTNYLYNKSLPSNFYEDSNYYQSALNKIQQNPINIQSYKNNATEKLGVLYKSFIDNIFDLYASFPLFENLSKKLTQLNDTAVLRRADDTYLREVAQQAVEVADVLSSGQIGWIETDYFDPGPGFLTLVNNITQSSFLGEEIANELSALADTEFVKFKLALPEYKSDLTGSFFEIKQGQLRAAPSSGLVQFIDTISLFLNEPFMNKVDSHTLEFKIPAHQLLFWDENILKRAVKMIDLYQDFSTQKYQTQFENMSHILKTIALNSIEKKIFDLIAEGQIFQQDPQDDSFAQQELLQAQAKNLSIVTPLFAKILTTLQKGNTLIQNAQLKNLLIQESLTLVHKIEKILSHDQLYKGDEEAILRWDGTSLLGLKMFAVHDVQDMKAYLKAQRLRIAYLAKEFIEPVLNFLSLDYMGDLPFDTSLATKWARIIAVLDDYEKQTPGNNLKKLEDFLTYDLNDITFDNYQKRLDKIENFIDNDYFLTIRENLKTLILERISLNSFELFQNTYNEAAEFFNNRLAGRFPFIGNNENNSDIEASPANVKIFLDLMSQIPKTSMTLFSKNLGKNLIGESIDKFLEDVKKIRPLLDAILTKDSSGDFAKIGLEVDFRTDRTQEKGGEQIIDWKFQIDNEVLDLNSISKQNYWSIGMPLQLSFKWAQDGSQYPILDTEQNSDLSVSDLTATYSYKGNWALLRLIDLHNISLDSFLPSDSSPLILKFIIPTRGKEKITEEDRKKSSRKDQYQKNEYLNPDSSSPLACLYLRMILTGQVNKDKKENQKSIESLKKLILSFIPLSFFPSQAPILSSSREILQKKITIE